MERRTLTANPPASPRTNDRGEFRHAPIYGRAAQISFGPIDESSVTKPGHCRLYTKQSLQRESKLTVSVSVMFDVRCHPRIHASHSISSSRKCGSSLVLGGQGLAAPHQHLTPGAESRIRSGRKFASSHTSSDSLMGGCSVAPCECCGAVAAASGLEISAQAGHREQSTA